MAVLFIDALQRMVRIAQEGKLQAIDGIQPKLIPRRRREEQAGDVGRQDRDELVRLVSLPRSRATSDLPVLPGGSTPRGTVSSPLHPTTLTSIADMSVYLTGSTLFLSLILSRVFYIILDFITVQEQYTALQSKTARSSGNAGESDELRKRIKELEAELGKSQSSDRDFGAWSRARNSRVLAEETDDPRSQLEEAGVSAERRVQQTG